MIFPTSSLAPMAAILLADVALPSIAAEAARDAFRAASSPGALVAGLLLSIATFSLVVVRARRTTKAPNAKPTPSA